MENKKTVWIINHYALTPEQGGLCRHYYFAKELEKRGYNVRIFTSSAIHNTEINMISDGEGLFKEVPYDGIKYTYIKSPQYKGNGISRIKNMLGFAFDIRKIWKEYSYEKPDVIYTSSPDIFTAWRAEAFAKKHKIPCVVEIRDLWPLSIVEYKNISPKNPVIIALFMLEKRIYKKADSLIFTMPGGKDYITYKKWQKSVSADKIFNVNNGIDIALQETQKTDYFYEDADLSDNGKFKVVYAGSIRTANSIGTLVEAAEYLKDYKDIVFYLYGKGSDKEYYEGYCAKRNIASVKFKGYVDKKYLASILERASLCILTYKNVKTWKYGGSQNKMFDYMNAGKPILTNIKMGHSVIEKYDCGVELDTDDSEKLAKAIYDIYSMPADKYLAVCKNAKEGAKDFDYKVLTDKLEEAINYAIKAKEKN